MYPGTFADTAAGRPAVILHGGGQQTFAELDARSTRLARLLASAGLGPADTVALVLENRLEWGEAVWAPLRSGMWVAPLNWHLGAAELEYLVRDSRASALITSAARVAEFGSVGDVPHVFVLDEPAYEAALAVQSSDRREGEILGARLLYSSGSTGRPKGIRQPLPNVHPADSPPRLGGLVERLELDAGAVFLNAAPCYHAAPFQFSLICSSIGATMVHLARFDAQTYLEAIATHRVTHAQVVPTMLVRLLRLPADVRAAYDLSSLRVLVTSGAPCPQELKAAVAAWLGPVVHEYYGASEGYGQTHVSPTEAAQRPGTVGRAIGGQLHVTDDDGAELTPGQVGTVWFSGTAQFEYDGDAEKSRESRNERGWTTVGDLGRLDAQGYLFLTGRRGHTIISGGVNIYPQEVEDALMVHPDVFDVAVVGVPDPEWGEAVHALVQLCVGIQVGPKTAAGLVEHVRERLARFKAPRTIDFVDDLPRLPSGKLNRPALRAQLDRRTPMTRGAELGVLHVLRVRGATDPAALPRLTGLDGPAVEDVVGKAVAAGHALLREGRGVTLRLTPEGKEHAAALLRAEATPESTAAVEAVYMDFLPLNTELKELTTAWQMRDGEPNDHTDADYDATVIERLAAVDAGIAAALATESPLSRYRPRFAAALTRVRAGELAAFARPMADSFHDAWMELHQDLLFTLDRERSAADGH
ncbi:MAG TPA: AMP-binding protein [Sporichthyaceae bacterium]|jgi:fatty-acyl-CoA synthase|nr:AMP-binding protein [Sporichthyaceae bacterium]